MIDWLRRFGLRKETPATLTGAPVVRRVKTYSASSGFVYQYFYAGHRSADSGRASATEFVFEVSANRKTSFPVSVLLEEESVAFWQREHSRDLNSTERYAIAKLALFQAFDERLNPDEARLPVHIRPADLDLIAGNLGLL
jgi:hypothetical protein